MLAMQVYENHGYGDNVVLLIWLGLGTKTSWLGFKKYPILSQNTGFGHLKAQIGML